MGRGIGVTVTSNGVERHAPGIVFRHFDEQTPLVGYGVAWSATGASPFLDTFLEVALEVAGPQGPPVGRLTLPRRAPRSSRAGPGAGRGEPGPVLGHRRGDRADGLE